MTGWLAIVAVCALTPDGALVCGANKAPGIVPTRELCLTVGRAMLDMDEAQVHAAGAVLVLTDLSCLQIGEMG